jgi:hypothetical protein
VVVGEREQPLGVVQERRHVRRVGGLHDDADKKIRVVVDASKCFSLSGRIARKALAAGDLRRWLGGADGDLQRRLWRPVRDRQQVAAFSLFF